MEVLTKMPATIKERMEYGDELRIPASWEEFLDLQEVCEYRIEYDNGEIISFMGYATKEHEKVIGHIVRLLGNLLNLDSYSVYGSNLAIHSPGLQKKYFNADCAVVKGQEEEVVLRGIMKAVTNPILLVEIHSATTEEHDLGRKFRSYTKIPSLKQLLYLESTEMRAYNYLRNGSAEWSYREYSSPNDEIPILDEGALTLSDLYKNVKF